MTSVRWPASVRLDGSRAPGDRSPSDTDHGRRRASRAGRSRRRSRRGSARRSRRRRRRRARGGCRARRARARGRSTRWQRGRRRRSSARSLPTTPRSTVAHPAAATSQATPPRIKRALNVIAVTGPLGGFGGLRGFAPPVMIGVLTVMARSGPRRPAPRSRRVGGAGAGSASTAEMPRRRMRRRRRGCAARGRRRRGQ